MTKKTEEVLLGIYLIPGSTIGQNEFFCGQCNTGEKKTAEGKTSYEFENKSDGKKKKMYLGIRTA